MKFTNFVVIVGCLFFINGGGVLADDKTKSGNLTVKDKNIELNKALFWASFNGNYEKVKKLIEQGANVNYSTPNIGIVQGDGLTPLHRAVGLGDEAKLDLLKPPDRALVERRLKVAELLIRKGANVNAKSFLGRTPLHMAETKEAAELLIKHGADVNAQDGSGATPLFTLNGNYRKLNRTVAEVFINHGADVNHVTKSGETVLQLAARNNDKNLAELLVEHGADVNFKFENRHTALEDAFQGGNEEIAEYLIKQGAYLSKNSSLGYTELNWAVMHNDLELVKRTLARGDAVDYVNKEGDTPLLLAIFKSCEPPSLTPINHGKEIAEVLINYGADVDAKSKIRSDRPLFTFIKDAKLMSLLLKSGVDVNAVDSSGRNYLYYIHDKNLIELIEKSGRSKIGIEGR